MKPRNHQVEAYRLAKRCDVEADRRADEDAVCGGAGGDKGAGADGCQSAWGFRADRHDKALKSQWRVGLRCGAGSQARHAPAGRTEVAGRPRTEQRLFWGEFPSLFGTAVAAVGVTQSHEF